MRYHCLDQQVVVITGASSGIGEALAHQFYSAGCRVVLASRRVGELERVRSDLLRKTSDDIRFIRPDIVQLDLLELDKIPAKCAQILEQCKHVDILINNGGISLRSDVLSVTSDVDQRMMKINYLGAVALTKGKYANRQFYGDEFDRLVSIFFYRFSAVYDQAPAREHRVRQQRRRPAADSLSLCVHCIKTRAASVRRLFARRNSLIEREGLRLQSRICSDECLTERLDRFRAPPRRYLLRIPHLSPHFNSILSLTVMDPETAAGESPEKCASEIFKSILAEDNESLPIQYALIAWLRVSVPPLFFYIMERRAKDLASRYRSTQFI